MNKQNPKTLNSKPATTTATPADAKLLTFNAAGCEGELTGTLVEPMRAISGKETYCSIL